MKACLGAANSLLPKENDKRSNHAEKGQYSIQRYSYLGYFGVAVVIRCGYLLHYTHVITCYNHYYVTTGP